MEVINKIRKSRNLLKQYLEDEWKTDIINDYTNDEIRKIYMTKSDTALSFGKASSLNMTLQHKLIPSHKLHIIYYNFPEINSPFLKVTKTCGDKIQRLYTDEVINPEDSIILIITDTISENIEKTIEDLYKQGQEELLTNNLSDSIITENEKLGESKLRNEHFRNIHIFDINRLTFDPMKHSLVPNHRYIRNMQEIDSILKKTNTNKEQLPIILRKDSIAKLLRLAPGDICEITRVSEKCGEYIYYRICE
jgi:DNA-directed RNA polymerase subunit H (RpoH/RPB5)